MSSEVKVHQYLGIVTLLKKAPKQDPRFVTKPVKAPLKLPDQATLPVFQLPSRHFIQSLEVAVILSSRH